MAKRQNRPPLRPIFNEPITIYQEEIALIHEPGSLRKVDERRLSRLVGLKALRLILERHHGFTALEAVQAIDEESVSFTAEVSPPAPPSWQVNWGNKLEVVYSLPGQLGRYRHVFHYFLDRPDSVLQGRLFTQKRRHIAR